MKRFIVFCLLNPIYAFSQNIGIGTNTPTRARLEVFGAVDATAAIFGDGTGISLQRNWPGIGFNSYWNGGNRYLANGYAAKQFMDPTSGFMYLDIYGGGTADNLTVSTTRALTISPAGNVGLAGAPANGQLQLSNTLFNRKIVLWESANNNHEYFGLGIESGTMRYAIAGAGNVHRFYAGNGPNASTLLMSIWGNKTVIVGEHNSGSRMGINTGFPAYTLDIFQAPGAGGLRLLSTDWHNTNWELRNAIYSNDNFTSCLQLIYNGNSIKGWFRPDTGGYSAQSDERKKKNIETLEPILNKVMQLRPARYQMRESSVPNTQAIGLIAQEAKILFPELVDVVKIPLDSNNKISDHHGVDYSGLGVIAIKAIQEQQIQIEALKEELRLLRKKVDK